MEQTVVDLITSRLERIEKQNDDQLALLRDHIKDASVTKQTVARHTTYFKIMGYGMPPLVAYVAAKLGLK